VSDDARQKILARRARFVAAALAGLTSTGCDETSPEPCLSPVATGVDAGTTASTRASVERPPGPSVCLSPMPPPEDAGSDAGPPDAGKKTAIPVPHVTPIRCLVPVRKDRKDEIE
jgi:hypothetical protein